MTESSIPADVFNPGQVFASLGFLEVAEVLCGDAEGGFDWRDESNVRFLLRTQGDRNPFEVVLEFLAKAEVLQLAPAGYSDATHCVERSSGEIESDDESELPASSGEMVLSEVFPAARADASKLPIRLSNEDRSLDVGHWADGSLRNDFKLYAGNRSAALIARAMLRGSRHKPRKRQALGDLKTKGVQSLWHEGAQRLLECPFDVLTPIGGSFNFDPRGAWKALDAGYSPNAHKHGVAASPVVEILAAIGLEHARPEETDVVRYAVWGVPLPPLLARPALAGSRCGIPLRRFLFRLDTPGKGNRIVTYAQEDTAQ